MRERSVSARAIASGDRWLHHVGRADPLGDVAPGVVHLEEQPAPAAVASALPVVPDVRHEQQHVARLGLEHRGRAAVVGEVIAAALDDVERRQPPRAMAPRHDGRRPIGKPAVTQHEVRRDREHRIRDAVVPRHTVGAGDVRARVAVPRPAVEVGRVAPRGVRDHVAVVAEQRLDHREDARDARSPLGTRRCGSASRSGTRPCRCGCARVAWTRRPRRSRVSLPSPLPRRTRRGSVA